MLKISGKNSEVGLSRQGIIILILILAGGFGVYLVVQNQRKTDLKVTYSTAGATRQIPVTASGDEFKPNTFQIGHLEPIALMVTAVDKDYVLEIPEGGIHAALPQGQATEVQIGSLGLGKFEFICSQQCRGTIEVIPLKDEDDERKN